MLVDLSRDWWWDTSPSRKQERSSNDVNCILRGNLKNFHHASFEQRKKGLWQRELLPTATEIPVDLYNLFLTIRRIYIRPTHVKLQLPQ